MSQEEDTNAKDKEPEAVVDNAAQGQDPFQVKLPREIIDIIFSYLDPDSVKRVRLVSSHWKNVIELDKFWTWATLEVNSTNLQVALESKTAHLVSGIRNRRLPEGDFLDIVNKLFSGILAGDFSQLKNITLFPYEQWRSVKPSLLEAVVRLETFRLAFPTTKQIIVILKAIQESTDIRLKTLYISQMHDDDDMEPVKPELFKAVVKLEHSDMSHLTTEQLTVLFKTIQESTDLKLKTLDLRFNPIYSVEPELLKSLVKMEHLDLRYCDLNTEQITVLFRAIQESTDHKLKSLYIEDIKKDEIADVEVMEPGLLWDVIKKLEDCNLCNYLETEQLKDLFRDIMVSTDLKLKTLHINNISSVEPELLMGALKLEDCDLTCDLTTEQFTVLFRAIKESADLKLKTLHVHRDSSLSSNKLKVVRLKNSILLSPTKEQLTVLFIALQESTDLKLGTLALDGDLHLIEPDLLKVVVKFDNCHLDSCPREHAKVLIRAIQEATDLKLKTLNLSYNYRDMDSLEPKLFQAFSRLETCNLKTCYLTTEQLTVLLRAIQESEDCKLRELNLRDNDLSEVAPDILVEAVAKLEGVDLTDTDLTTDQLTGIFRLMAKRRIRKLRWIKIFDNHNIKRVKPSLRQRAKENPIVNCDTYLIY